MGSKARLSNAVKLVLIAVCSLSLFVALPPGIAESGAKLAADSSESTSLMPSDFHLNACGYIQDSSACPSSSTIHIGKPPGYLNGPTFTINVLSVSGPLAVTLSVSSTLPPHTTYNLTPDSGNAPYMATLTITCTNQTPQGTYQVTIEGTGANGVTHTTNTTLNVKAFGTGY